MKQSNDVYTSPTIMSTAMVCALLDDRKTCTRRIPTSQWANVAMHFDMGHDIYLWVRESWGLYPKTAWHAPKIISPTDPDNAAYYKAGWERCKPTWKPSIHMPRWASRLSLRVTDVIKEPVRDISYDDAIREGIVDYTTDMNFARYGLPEWPEEQREVHPIHCFATLWDSLHGHKEGESWDDNPEVYAFTFEVIQQNIDEVAA